MTILSFISGESSMLKLSDSIQKGVASLSSLANSVSVRVCDLQECVSRTLFSGGSRESRVLWTLLSDEGLPDDIATLAEFLSAIKAHPNISWLDIYSLWRGHEKRMSDAKVKASFLSTYGYPYDATTFSSSVPGDTVTPADQTRRGQAKENQFGAFDSTLGDIRAQVIALQLQNPELVKQRAQSLIDDFERILREMINVIEGWRDDEPTITRMLNDWLREFFETTWKEQERALMQSYSLRKDAQSLAAQREQAVKAIEDNPLYPLYQRSYDIKTKSYNYVRLIQYCIDNSPLPSAGSAAPVIFAVKDLTSLFIAITKLAAYDALLDGQPLPSYQPLIPLAEEPAAPAPAAALTKDDRVAVAKVPKRRGRAMDNFEVWVAETDPEKKQEVIQRLNKIVPGHVGQELVKIIRSAVEHGLLHSMPSFPAIKRQFENVGSHQAYDSFKYEPYSQEELAHYKDLLQKE